MGSFCAFTLAVLIMYDHALIFYNNIMYLSAKVPVIAKVGSNVGFDAMNNVHKFTQCRLAITVGFMITRFLKMLHAMQIAKTSAW